jgi:hypothetical protein
MVKFSDIPPLLYDPDGNPIHDVLHWAQMRDDREVWIVVEDSHNGIILRTIWHGCPDDPWQIPPLIYGTAVLSADSRTVIAELDQYPTRRDALAGHARHLAILQTNTSPEPGGT